MRTGAPGETGKKALRLMARAVAWAGILAIIILSVVPADERPVTAAGPQFEHFTIFALTAAAFALGYQLSLARLMFLALLFCGGIELLQLPLPTRHARLGDFTMDFAASCLAICVVFAGQRIFGRDR